MDEAVDNNCQ